MLTLLYDTASTPLRSQVRLPDKVPVRCSMPVLYARCP